MTTSESKGRFFFAKRIDSHNESNLFDSNRELECSSTRYSSMWLDKGLYIDICSDVCTSCCVQQPSSVSELQIYFELQCALHLVFAYPDIRYPDLSVNFMAAKNPDILK